MADVVFDGVTCRYPGAGRPAVADLDLRIEDGEMLALHGDPGSGKSTLLRMVARLVPVTSGRILVGGQALGEGADPPISMLFQNYAVYPNLTVTENIGLPLTQEGMKKRAVAKRAKEAACWFDLDDVLSRQGNELSAGQRIRVGLARALVRQPAVVLMDEPLANLQPEVRDEVTALMLRAQQRHRTTTIYATADPQEAVALGGRVALLEEGVLREVATASELRVGATGQRVATPGFGSSGPIA